MIKAQKDLLKKEKNREKNRRKMRRKKLVRRGRLRKKQLPLTSLLLHSQGKRREKVQKYQLNPGRGRDWMRIEKRREYKKGRGDQVVARVQEPTL